MSELNERIQEGLKGNYEGLNNGFKDLNEVLFGVQKKCYTLIGGLSGCLAKDTKVVMYDGSYKKVQDVKEGDLLMGPDSKPRKVLELYSGREQMYWIRQNKGQDYRVNESHILSLRRIRTKYRRKTLPNQLHLPKNKRKRVKIPESAKKVVEYVNLPIKEVLNQKLLKKGWKGYKSELIEFDSKPIDIEPYLLGLWLGDGNSASAVITNTDDTIIQYLKSLEHYEVNRSKSNSIMYRIKRNPEIKVINKVTKEVTTYKDIKEAVKVLDVKAEYISRSITKTKEHEKYCFFREGRSLLMQLKSYNLIKNKHIPKEYLYNNSEVRLQLLAGLIDSDGHKYKNSNGYVISSSNKQLAEDITYLSRSLGFYTSLTKAKSSMIREDGSLYQSVIWRIQIHGDDLTIIPVKLERKKCKFINKPVSSLSTGIRIEKDIVDDYYGFNLDGDHLFLLEDFTVTHNTYKTTLLDYIFLNALEDAHRKNIKISVFYYSFEIDKLTKQCNWLSQMAFKKYNVIIPPKKIKGLGTNRLNSKEQKIIDSLIPVVEEMFSKINFIFDPVNPYGIFKEIFEYCLPKGEATYQEYKDENNQPKKRIASFKWYEDQYVLIGIDHLYLAKKEKNYTTKENMDKLSTNLVSLRNLFGVSPFVVQQFNQGLTAVDRAKFKGVDLSPQQTDFKDTTNPYQDCDVALGIINPFKLDMFDYQGYNTRILRDRFISLKVIKNRLDRDNVSKGLLARPEVGSFQELPPPQKINYSNYKI